MSIQNVLGISKEEKRRDVCLGIEEVTVKDHHQGDHTSFAKHLRWKLKTRDVEWMEITPAMAEEMLKYNAVEGFSNRPLSEIVARRYGRLMKAGRWGHQGRGTCEPIIFSDKGRILSAQHRLYGAVLEGATFRALVVFGEPDENFAYIDQGRRRTAADVFSINGIPNSLMAAATTRWLMAWDAGRTNSGDDGARVDPSNQEAYDAYVRLSGLQESIKRAGLKFSAERLPAPAVAAGVHYLCAQKSRKLADEYFERLATGLGFTSKRDPAYRVRKFLTEQDSGRITRRETAAALIEGWNAIRTNKPLTQVKAETVSAIV